MNISPKEREVLRTLASQYIEVASLPCQREKMELWKKFNNLEPARPMITINQLPWHELNGDGSLTCHVKDPVLGQLED